MTAGDPVATEAAPADTDGDGLSDKYEIEQGFDPAAVDTDSDGLSDGMEVALGTDASLADTDRDGLTDGAELRMGSDPLTAATPPATPETPGAEVPTEPKVPTTETGQPTGPVTDQGGLTETSQPTATTGQQVPQPPPGQPFQQMPGQPVGQQIPQPPPGQPFQQMPGQPAVQQVPGQQVPGQPVVQQMPQQPVGQQMPQQPVVQQMPQQPVAADAPATGGAARCPAGGAPATADPRRRDDRDHRHHPDLGDRHRDNGQHLDGSTDRRRPRRGCHRSGRDHDDARHPAGGRPGNSATCRRLGRRSEGRQPEVPGRCPGPTRRHPTSSAPRSTSTIRTRPSSTAPS